MSIQTRGFLAFWFEPDCLLIFEFLSRQIYSFFDLSLFTVNDILLCFCIGLLGITGLILPCSSGDLRIEVERHLDELS